MSNLSDPAQTRSVIRVGVGPRSNQIGVPVSGSKIVIAHLRQNLLWLPTVDKGHLRPIANNKAFERRCKRKSNFPFVTISTRFSMT